MEKNRFGLARPIPEAIKRQVRQRCGYGCVICAKAPYDYDHFAPEFIDAKSHDPDGITLLCYEHHGMKTDRLLSNVQVSKYNKDPKAKAIGHAFGKYITDGVVPKFSLGSSYAHGASVLLEANGQPVIWASPPVEPGAPFSFNALLRDKQGRTILEIRDNEWRVGIEIWDVTVVANRVEIRSKKGSIDLVISMTPPDILNVERANLSYGGCDVIVEKNGRVIVGDLPIDGFMSLNGYTLISIETQFAPVGRRAISALRSTTFLSAFPR